MFSDGDISLKPLEEDYPVIPWYKSCVASNPVMATRVTVKGATGLEKQQTIGSEWLHVKLVINRFATKNVPNLQKQTHTAS